MAVNGRPPDVGRIVSEFPARREMTDNGEIVRGLAVRLQLARPMTAEAEPRGHASAELHLGEAARFFPTDAALASWTAQAHQGQATVVYEAG